MTYNVNDVLKWFVNALFFILWYIGILYLSLSTLRPLQGFADALSLILACCAYKNGTLHCGFTIHMLQFYSVLMVRYVYGHSSILVLLTLVIFTFYSAHERF